jgi:hypothetical protein
MHGVYYVCSSYDMMLKTTNQVITFERGCERTISRGVSEPKWGVSVPAPKKKGLKRGLSGKTSDKALWHLGAKPLSNFLYIYHEIFGLKTVKISLLNLQPYYSGTIRLVIPYR